MRAFLAINLEEHIRTEVEYLQQDLQTKVRGFRWVKRDLLHITLKFLGDIEPAAVSTISKVMDTVTYKHAPFTLSFAGIGAFPTMKRPRIIWVGLEKGVTELTDLALNIEQALQVTDWQGEQIQREQKGGKRENFKPHLTVGRAKKNEATEISNEVFQLKWHSTATLRVDSFSLMESNLFSSGPVYKTVRKFLLK